MKSRIIMFLLCILWAGSSFGQTWTAVSQTASTYNLTKVIFLNPTTGIAVGAKKKILKTTNAGADWSAVTNDILGSSTIINGIAYSGSTLFAVTNNGRYTKSNDEGATWSSAASGVTAADICSGTAIKNIYANGGSLYAITDHVVYCSANNGESWSKIFVNKDPKLSAMCFLANGKWFLIASYGSDSYYSRIYRSSNSGISWDSTDVSNDQYKTITFSDENNGYIAGSTHTAAGAFNAIAYKTTNGGQSWEKIEPLAQSSSSEFTKVLFRDNKNGIMIGTVGLIYVTRDGGNSWVINSLPESAVTNLRDVFFTDENTGYIVGDGGKIYKTADADLPVELTSFTASTKADGVVLRWSTATETNNSGFEIERKSWNDNSACLDWKTVGYIQGKGNSNSTTEYSFFDSRLCPGKYSYRLKQVDFDGTFKYSAEINSVISKPESFELSQNYPNPFNPSTVISYTLASAGNVELRVFDALGREVASLVNEKQEAGNHTAEFNSSKLQLASGIYIARLKSGNFTKSIKMNLIK